MNSLSLWERVRVRVELIMSKAQLFITCLGDQFYTSTL